MWGYTSATDISPVSWSTWPSCAPTGLLSWWSLTGQHVSLGKGMLSPGRDNLLNPSYPPGLAGMCRSGSETLPLVSSRLWLQPTPSRPTCGASSDGQGSAGDGAEWLGVSGCQVFPHPFQHPSVVEEGGDLLLGVREGPGSHRHWSVTMAAAAGASQPPPSLPGTPQPPESSCCSASWTTLSHVAPLKPSRVSHAPSKAMTCSLRYASSRQCFLYALRNYSVFLREAAKGEGCPRRASSPWPACGCLVYRCSWSLSCLPALDSFHMCCWFSPAYFFF